ncbi:protection of telomeres protein 1 isoform X2 [Lampris incognitus]|nr:protection of telomeres protein 1 isoform X2 [Lampris incognitus]XP_056138097.1 protection of telomeres protein 1 isoform X2 [Lampris incognitus]
MPVQLVFGGTSGTQVPAHLTRLPIPLISTSTDCSDKTVKGKVTHKGPLVFLGDDEYLLKAVIEEESPQQKSSSEQRSINVILFGEIAKDFSETVRQGDVLEVAGFTVGNSPTFQKDKLHPCNLHLSGEQACIYVLSSAFSAVSLPANKRSSSAAAKVLKSSKVSKYTYTRLSELKPGAVVNVYGVVVFFKQPFMSKGTDYCSTLKITDQSNQKVSCTIFCEKPEDHPRIFKTGDIVRLHRVKTKLFDGAVSLLNTFGFSVVTFDGAEGAAIIPRTASRSFHFNQVDQQTVEELRAWAATQGLISSISWIPLSAVQPKVYFDLTCQLLSKAPVDSTCVLLKVWDGTRCTHPLMTLSTEPAVTEGTSSLSKERDNLIAIVFVYDDHVEGTRKLKPGDFIRIYNLHALPAAGRLPGDFINQSEGTDKLVFHLHWGTSFGRGIRILPNDSQDIQDLKSVLELFPEDELNDSVLLEVWSTPPGTLDGSVEYATERRCAHNMDPVPLAQVKQADLFGQFHVKAQLRSYQPLKLYQALKLHCPKCNFIRDIPDGETVADLFSEASLKSGATPVPWAISGTVHLPAESHNSCSRTLTFYQSRQLITEGRPRDLVYLMGATLQETKKLAVGDQNIIPVLSLGGSLTLLPLSAPFLFQGRKQFYGCSQCSQVCLKALPEGMGMMTEKAVAEALGVQLLHHSLLMKLELQDETDMLQAFLWRDAEQFFQVSAEEAAASQEVQDVIQQTMTRLCSAGSSMTERPWLHLCLTSYQVEDNGQKKTCYQICNTAATINQPRC